MDPAHDISPAPPFTATASPGAPQPSEGQIDALSACWGRVKQIRQQEQQVGTQLAQIRANLQTEEQKLRSMQAAMGVIGQFPAGLGK